MRGGRARGRRVPLSLGHVTRPRAAAELRAGRGWARRAGRPGGSAAGAARHAGERGGRSCAAEPDRAGRCLSESERGGDPAARVLQKGNGRLWGKKRERKKENKEALIGRRAALCVTRWGGITQRGCGAARPAVRSAVLHPLHPSACRRTADSGNFPRPSASVKAAMAGREKSKTSPLCPACASPRNVSPSGRCEKPGCFVPITGRVTAGFAAAGAVTQALGRALLRAAGLRASAFPSLCDKCGGSTTRCRAVLRAGCAQSLSPSPACVLGYLEQTKRCSVWGTCVFLSHFLLGTKRTDICFYSCGYLLSV